MDWKVWMVTKWLNPTDAKFSLKHVVLQKLTYPLATTTFTCQQCQHILAPALTQDLARVGVVCTYPRTLAHGPLQYGGLDIPNLYSEQAIAHIHTILQYGPCRDNRTGHLLHSFSEALWLELGYSGDLMEAPVCLSDHITKSWIKHVWLSMQECGITLLTDFADLPSQRQGDREIMRLFVQYGLRQLQLQTLNQCRMYLQVVWVSGIVLGSGDWSLPQCLDQAHPAKSHLDWLHTKWPNTQAWMIWRKALGESLHLGWNQQLPWPLGKWLATSNPSGWYYHSATNSLWESKGPHWHQHGGTPQQTNQHNFHTASQADQLPPFAKLEKATIIWHGSQILLTGSGPCVQPEQGIDPCHQMWMSLFSQQWELDLQLKGSQWQMQEALSSALGYAVCNGSFKDANGAAAWLIECPDSHMRIEGKWHTPGHQEDHSSFCSKLAGIVGALYTLSFWLPLLPSPPLHLACDGLLVVSRLQSDKPIEPMEPHMDLLGVACMLLTTCGYQVQLVFVCGHQDQGYPTVLTWDAWLNVEVDS